MEHLHPERHPRTIIVNRLAPHVRLIRSSQIVKSLLSSKNAIERALFAQFPFSRTHYPDQLAADEHLYVNEYSVPKHDRRSVTEDSDNSDSFAYRPQAAGMQMLLHARFLNDFSAVTRRTARLLSQRNTPTFRRLTSDQKRFTSISKPDAQNRSALRETAIRSGRSNSYSSVRIVSGVRLLRAKDWRGGFIARPLPQDRRPHVSVRSVLDAHGAFHYRTRLKHQLPIRSLGVLGLRPQPWTNDSDASQASPRSLSASNALARLLAPKVDQSETGRGSTLTIHQAARVSPPSSVPPVVLNYSPKVVIPPSIESDTLEARVLAVLKRHGHELHAVLSREITTRRRTEF